MKIRKIENKIQDSMIQVISLNEGKIVDDPMLNDMVRFMRKIDIIPKY